MKLRQKLAMVLATAMVVTAVPVVTMAASTNRVTHIAKVSEGTTLAGNVAPDLKIELKDGITTTSPIYVTLENATWDKDGAFPYKVGDTIANVGTGAFKVVSIDKKEMAVQYVGTIDDAAAITATKGYTLNIPMKVTVTGGEARAHIAGTKWVTGTDEKGIAIATTKEGSASIIKPASVPSFYTEGGKLASIVLQEDTIGAIAATAKGGNVTFTIEVNADDFEINKAGGIDVKFSRGFASQTLNSLTAGQTAIAVGKGEIKVTVPVAAVTGSDIGRIEVSGITMKSTNRKPALGEITVSVDNNAFDNSDVVVANVAEYGVTLKNATKDEKVVEMVSGRKSEVKFTLKESVDATISSGRELEFSLEEGFFTKASEIKVKHKGATTTELNKVEVVSDKDGNITGFTVKAEKADGTQLIKDGQIDAIEVVANVILPMDKTGEITVKAAGRGLGEEKTLVIATAKQGVKVESEKFVVNSGVKEQKGGKIVITETDKGMLGKGDLTFTLPVENGIEFTAKPTVEVTSGDLKIAEKKDMTLANVYDVKVLTHEYLGVAADKLPKDETKYKVVSMDETTLKEYNKKNEVLDKKLTGVKVIVPVTRQSKEASKITVTDFEVKLDRSVPTGAYDLKVAGSAVGTKGNFNQKGFFEVGIKTENVGQKVVTTITKDATDMVVNGKKVTLPAAAYINGNKLMAPLRAVANAFGFENSAINYNSATKEILIRGNGSVIKLAIGSKQAFVDGTPITLAVPAEIKAEATYVPVGDLGRLLGIKVEWDNATKTATFKN